MPEGAFAAVPRLRPVSVASGIRFVGAEAWQCCRQLRMVKMPVSVVSIADNAFRGCQLLTGVTVPGCLEFGCKVFFSTSTDAVWAWCPGHRLRKERAVRWWRKRTKAPKPTQAKPQARRPNLHHLVVFPLHWVKRVKQKLMAIMGLNSRKKRTTAQVCGQGKSPRRLQTDYPSRILVTSGHTTVWQNKVTLQVSCLAMLKRR